MKVNTILYSFSSEVNTSCEVLNMGFSTLTKNNLIKGGVTNLLHLLNMTEGEILRIPGLGRKGLGEIRNFIENEYGVRLR